MPSVFPASQRVKISKVSSHQKIVNHIKSLGEIKEIMSSMKTLSLLELRKLTQLIPNQERMVESCDRIANDFIQHHPSFSKPRKQKKCCLLMIGSERGFCEDFNDKLIDVINDDSKEKINHYDTIIAVGQKLSALLEDHPFSITNLDGISTSDETSRVIQEIINSFNHLQTSEKYNCLHVLYFQHSDRSINLSSLVPPFESMKLNTLDNNQHKSRKTIIKSYPPELNLEPKHFYGQLVEQYLFFRLHELLYSSLQTENEMRIKHLGSAIDRLTEKIDDLTNKWRIMRQEEITEEIEIILLNSD